MFVKYKDLLINLNQTKFFKLMPNEMVVCFSMGDDVELAHYNNYTLGRFTITVLWDAIRQNLNCIDISPNEILRRWENK